MQAGAACLSHLCEDPVALNLLKLRISEPKGKRPRGRTDDHAVS